MINKRHTLYGTVEVDNNKELDYLDTNIPEMSFTNTIDYVVPQHMIGRIDLISFIHYGDVRYWWLIAQVNEIINPIEEVTLVKRLKIPLITAYYEFYDENSKVDTIEGKYNIRSL